MKYFEGLTQENEIKARYKELAKLHHPDLGGCVELMKEINGQYEQVITDAYQRAGKSITEVDELLAKDSVLRGKIHEIIAYPDIDVEICGSWIWVSGNTKDIKDKLKEAKFFWARNKCSWFWRAEENKSYNRKSMSLDDIRLRHGSHALKGNFKRAIA